MAARQTLYSVLQQLELFPENGFTSCCLRLTVFSHWNFSAFLNSQKILQNKRKNCIIPLCWVTLAPPPWKQIVRYESNKPIKSKLTHRQSINQSTERFTLEVYAWLIDLIHRRKNCPMGMISGWVQKATEHSGTKQYDVANFSQAYFYMHCLCTTAKKRSMFIVCL